MTPETRYAKSGDVHIAYQVIGDGPVDLVLSPGWITHVELAWEDPLEAAFRRRLASFSRRRWHTFMRYAASPGAAVALLRMNSQIDVRDVLPTIRVRTLVLFRRDARFGHGAAAWRQQGRDPITPAGEARDLAERIPEARLVELPGADHLPWVGDADSVLGEVEEFLTGVRRAPEPDRVLATILFTDIVGSTAQAARLGDRGWRELLTRHHALVRRQLERFRGHELNTVGDGFVASFDGPARAMRCARAIADSVSALGLSIRAGLHTGECELADGQLTGIAVHIAARIAALAEPNEVLVSSGCAG